MRKNVFGRQLKRDRNERRSLFKSLISSLITNERIKTTEKKAKAIKGEAEKIITKAKKGDKARRLLSAVLLKDAVDKAIYDIGPRFAQRRGGYSRIIKIGRRLSDNAEMVLMELVEGNEVKNSELKGQGLDRKIATTEAQKKNETLKGKQRVTSKYL